MRSDPQHQATVQAAQALSLLHPAARALQASLVAHDPRDGPVATQALAEIARLGGRMALLQEQAERQLDLLAPNGELGRAAERLRAGFFAQSHVVLSPLLRGAMEGATHFTPGSASFEPSFQRDLTDLLLLRDALIEEALHQSEQARETARREIALAVAVLLAVVLCLAALMRLLHTRVIRPLAEAARAIHEFASGDADVDMPQVLESDEIGEVVGALHKLQSSQRRAAHLAAERDALIDKLRALSSTDPLTGLLNRRAFFESAERELANGLRHGFEVAVLLMDIDHFKSVNDEHGHAAGDQALVAVAACLQASLRQGDVLARHGGEEFVILLTHCGRLSAIGFAERLRVAVSEIQLGSGDEAGFTLTASLGIAASGDNGSQLSALLSQADAAMYCAKRAGRNQVMAAPALAGAHPARAAPTLKTPA
jgi:diguanylate cyclase (GGDEF)-like protein